MAQNTFRKTSVKENAPKKEELAEPKPKLKFNFTLLKDERFKLIVGLLLIFFSISLTFSLLSYFFTGEADQSVVESLFETGFRSAGQEAENWLGLMGAVMAHLFVFKGFGIASIVLSPLFFFYGIKIVFKRAFFPIKQLFNYSIFFVFWLSITFGFLTLQSETESTIGFIGGGIGYELATLVDEMLGVATYLFIILSFIIFLIFTLNITTFAFKTKVKVDENEDITTESDEINEKSETEEDQANEEDDLQTEIKEEDFELKTIAKPAYHIPELELTIENQELLEPVIEQQPTFQLPKHLSDQHKDFFAPANKENDEDVSKAKVLDEFDISNLPPYDPTLDLSSYRYPTLDLLKDYGTNKGQSVTKEELEENKLKIVQTLADFSIGITSIKATIGPTVTLYEIVPDAGIKISKIANLSDDIALRLAALGVRIIAPMPGKGTIGMEVPNKNKQMVPARDVMMDDKFANSNMELPIAFGKTISNEIFVADLATMPHLLMAGATGMGKSVGINMLLTSLLYKKHPSQLKIVMVDPKKVELSIYSKIERHFLAKLPDGDKAIITDTKKVVQTLNSLCIEMDTRYTLLEDANCRNLKEYNPKFISRKLNPNDGHRYMPYIVVVIDELADLMMTAGKEVEMPIARLAQLARAVGIHLVLATQRPSVTVITGLIKANFPARLSFRVTSKMDSRIILDEGGSDQLVGKGDMLLKINSETIRLQCAFIDTPEVENIVDFIGEQRGYLTAYQLPEYFDENSSGAAKEIDLANKDPKFEEAARLIVTHQQGSTSLIQRKMALGYARSGRLMDQLEAAGIVGPPNGSKVRDVMIKDESSLQAILDTL
jgi:DNA segregation ATPase FtsK/SpoIIIE, S-DNA-T family